ncbi:carbohydrate-binding protein [Corallococcus sp. H22C18031201]|uniref:polysaccharide lyase n=1 Tax=Citreicoccus inhibens TaxID=2849499 RepID=UPI000E761339|nr:polysaccharide lyase [Citreicoccus inhibens]MBU8896423.1 polysaccharide lyase [Citreicoccus inhibens]RJS24197.1 carbohydrate-binding protein [Corallococcus sp. H22C18031201]
MKQLLRLVAVVPFLPLLASANPLWKGDFETGNTSQWTREQSVSASRLQVVTDVVREGRYALKATVHQGDDPINGSGNRNELLYLSQETQGDEYFYKWSTLFPNGYPSADSWQVFTQWHQEGCCGSPPLEFFVRGEQMNMRVGGVNGPILWKAPIDRGNWHDFVLHVKWSPNPKEGFVELYHNGTLVVPKTFGANQFGSDKNYLKQGLYRDASIGPEASVYHDGFVMGTSLEDVMPAGTQQTPAADAGSAQTPAPDAGTTPPSTLTQPGQGTPTPVSTLVPGSTNSDVMNGGAQGQGCSATGGAAGMPALAAAGLFTTALFRRRRPALAKNVTRR